MNWDDVRIFASLVSAGTVAGAAAQLRVNASTVTRRIRVLEEALGVRLFDRLAGGYRLTPAGRAIADRTGAVVDAMAEVSLEAGGRDAKLAGPIRLTMLSSMASIVTPILAELLDRYPDIMVEVVTDYVLLDLARRQSDIALRVTPAPPSSLFGRRIAEVGFGGYIHRDLAPAYEDRATPLPWLGTEGQTTPDVEVTSVYPSARLVGTFSRLVPAIEAVCAGMGATRLPCFAATDPRLVRLPLLDVWPTYQLWILTHETLRSNARVRTLMKFIGDALSTQASLFEG